MQLDMQAAQQQPNDEIIQTLSSMIRVSVRDNEPATPDVLVLPELLLPGPAPRTVDGKLAADAIVAHFQQGAIEVPGPETARLAALAGELQLSLVLGVAERSAGNYYNTVLLIDPEGVYGIYRKLHLTARDRLWATPGNLSRLRQFPPKPNRSRRARNGRTPTNSTGS